MRVAATSRSAGSTVPIEEGQPGAIRLAQRTTHQSKEPVARMTTIPRPHDPWTQAVRRQAYVAVEVAAAQRQAAHTTFGYYLRLALGHGLTVTEVAQAAGIDEATVRELTDPGMAA